MRRQEERKPVCLSVPARIVELTGRLAVVDVMGNRREADVSFVDEPQLGDYVLVHAGFAIEKMTPEDAAESLRIWEEIASLESGEPLEEDEP
ncbi:MAG TPA: HypC/HybG/HupF family hydrogenase formation chaperone [Planctomycetota bacterium]|nr:HypC/HybG/HupF family hydrogenase formation chaperone [Planctomycetota bacterium]